MDCDNFENCGNRATRNIQSAIIEWEVRKNGSYSANPIEIDADDEINEHLCDECEPEYSR